MNNDDVVWQIINRSFCSFMVKTKTGNFCRNENNVTGLCNRHSCPLANSQYATVKERDGVIFLFLKEPERVPYPGKQWERIKLVRNKKQALEQIKKHMLYWDKWMISRVKRRFFRIRDNLKNMRRLALARQKKLEPVNRKIERRELRREEKALRVARVERTVEQELLERLRASTSSKEIYNIDQSAFEKALETEELEDEEEFEEESEEEEELGDVVYTSDSEIEDIEDLVEATEEPEEQPEENLVLAGPSKKRRITISYEKDE
ncbi:putative rna-binding nuclear protein mak16 [Fasciolopsis buskii]|uniref:Protein MAK16 homolog n=1 Tax=Fasciolopsis buskii TaxID=27845 RepID=A0A8E0RRM0_9TREM|nr:putative rna-binding nuclear protein mak16 [Fasciolopsis buski]